MNEEILSLIKQYRSGNIPVDLFLMRMRDFGLDQEDAVRALNEVGASERSAEPLAREPVQEAPAQLRSPPPQPTIRSAPPQLSVRELAQQAARGEITQEDYLSRALSRGMPINEAQTILSDVAGGSEQGLDPALMDVAQQPLNQRDVEVVESARALRPEQPTPPGFPQPSRPMTQEEIILARPREERQPIIPRILSNFGRDVRQTLAGDDASSAPAPSSIYTSPGAIAGNQIAQTPSVVQTAVDTAREVTQPATPDQEQAPTTGFNPAMAGPRPGYDDPNALTAAMEYNPGQAQRFRPMPEAAQQAVSIAKSIPQREVSSTQTAADGPSALASFIRGRFGDAAQGNPMDDRLTAFQEARDRSGEARATGGGVNAKAPLNKDAALHKALEIIQHLLTRS